MVELASISVSEVDEVAEEEGIVTEGSVDVTGEEEEASCEGEGAGGVRKKPNSGMRDSSVI